MLHTPPFSHGLGTQLEFFSMGTETEKPTRCYLKHITDKISYGYITLKPVRKILSCTGTNKSCQEVSGMFPKKNLLKQKRFGRSHEKVNW